MNIAENNIQMRAALERARVILSYMAQENTTGWRRIFVRWPVHHEPLRGDAKHALPVIDKALAANPEGERPRLSRGLIVSIIKALEIQKEGQGYTPRKQLEGMLEQLYALPGFSRDATNLRRSGDSKEFLEPFQLENGRFYKSREGKGPIGPTFKRGGIWYAGNQPGDWYDDGTTVHDIAGPSRGRWDLVEVWGEKLTTQPGGYESVHDENTPVKGAGERLAEIEELLAAHEKRKGLPPSGRVLDQVKRLIARAEDE